MNKKIRIHKKTAAVPPTQPQAPVTKMLLECKPSQTGGTPGTGATPGVDDMVTIAHVNLNAKNQQVRQVAEGTEDQDVIVLSQLEGYLQKGSKSIAGLFLPTSGGMMVGDIDMGTGQGNTIKGLPSSWGGAGYLGNDYAASTGIVKDVLGDYGDRIKNLIEKITQYAGTGNGSLDQLLTDLGSPKDNSQSGQTSSVTLEHPEQAKWLLLSAQNAMTGTLRLEQKQGALPTEPAPTIKNLKTGEVGVVGTATPKDKLQKIIAVSDLTTILNNLQNSASSGSSPGTGTGAGAGTTTTTFPQWTGQEVPYLMDQSPDSTGAGSTQSPVKSANADNYITKGNGTYSLLRRGIYLVTFAYELASPQQPGAVTCTGTLTPKTTTTPPTTTTGGTGSQTATSETVFSIKGSSDGLTVTGSSYILVPGEQAFSEYTLEMKLTSGDTGATTANASKSYVAISYMGAGY